MGEDATTTCLADEAEDMWSATKDLNHNGWKCSAIVEMADLSGGDVIRLPQLFRMPEPEIDSTADVPLGGYAMVDSSSAFPFSYVVPRRTLVFRFARGSSATGRVTKAYRAVLSADRHIFGLLVRDTLLCHYPAHEEATQQLLQLPVSGRQEPLLVEALLSLMLCSPDASGWRQSSRPYRFFVGRVILNLARVASFPATLVAAVDAFHDIVPSVPPTVKDFFNEWFSFFLSALNFQWKWDSSVDVAKTVDEEGEPLRLWLVSLLQTVLALTYRTRVQKLLPPELYQLLPPRDGPQNPFASKAGETTAAVAASEEQQGVYDRLTGMMRNKATSGAMIIFLEQKQRQRPRTDPEKVVAVDAADDAMVPTDKEGGGSSKESGGASHGRLWCLEPAVAVVLQRGAASIEHTIKALDRYSQVLEHVIDSSPETHAAAIRAVGLFWRRERTKATDVILRFVERRLVSAVAAVMWCFDQLKQFWNEGSCIWQLLHALALLLRRDGSVGDAKAFYVAVCSQFYCFTSERLHGEFPSSPAEGAWTRELFARLQHFSSVHHRSMTLHWDVISVALKKDDGRIAAAIADCVRDPYHRCWQ